MRRPDAGFTLLEVLVSIAISALALTAIIHIVGDARGFDVRLDHRSRFAREADTLFTLVEQLVTDTHLELKGSALALSRQPASAPVSGNAQEIVVTSRGPRALAFDAPTVFTINVDSDWGQQRVRLSWPRQSQGSQDETVVSSAGDLRFRYAALSASNKLVWSDQWARPVAELKLLGVTLVDLETGQQSSKLIRLDPMLPQVCVLNPLLEGCPSWH